MPHNNIYNIPLINRERLMNSIPHYILLKLTCIYSNHTIDTRNDYYMEQCNWAWGLNISVDFMIRLFWNPDHGIVVNEMADRDCSWLNIEHFEGHMFWVPSWCITMTSCHGFSFASISTHQRNHVSPCLSECMAVENSIWVVHLMAHYWFVCNLLHPHSKLILLAVKLLNPCPFHPTSYPKS